MCNGSSESGDERSGARTYLPEDENAFLAGGVEVLVVRGHLQTSNCVSMPMKLRCGDFEF